MVDVFKICSRYLPRGRDESCDGEGPSFRARLLATDVCGESCLLDVVEMP